MHLFKFHNNVFAEFGAAEADPPNCPDFLNLSPDYLTGLLFPQRKVFSGIKVCTFSGELFFLGFLTVTEDKCHNMTSLAREMAFHL